MITLKQVREGSIVYLRGDFGTGPLIRAIVTNVEQDIKNGLPGIDYYPATDAGDDRWAYLDQIQSVYKY